MIRSQRRFFIKEIETAKVYNKETGELVENSIDMIRLPIGQWEDIFSAFQLENPREIPKKIILHTTKEIIEKK